MNSREYLVSDKGQRCAATLDTDTARWTDLCASRVREVKIECTEEDMSFWNNSKTPSGQIQSPEYVNYYDNTTNVLQHVKKELSEAKSPEANNNLGSIDSRVSKPENSNSDNRFLINSNVKDKVQSYQVTIKSESIDDEGEAFHNKDQELVNTRKYCITIKTEWLVDCETLIITNGSVHHDTLVTPRRVECKLCGRPFKNVFKLLKHNIDHIKLNVNPMGLVKMDSDEQKTSNRTTDHAKNTVREYQINKLYRCLHCDKSFQKQNKLHSHLNTVHSTGNYFCDHCGKRFRCLQYIRTHMQTVHPPEMRSNTLKCPYCNIVFKHKYNLHCHVKTIHNNELFKCETCKAVFKCKQYLQLHCKRMHYDYGRMFPCRWCDKEFRTPLNLKDHTKRIHIDLVVKQKAGVVV